MDFCSDQRHLKKKCCVPNCGDKQTSRLFRFPNKKDTQLFQQWLNVIKNPKLFNLPMETVYENFTVCSRHFRSEEISQPGSKRGVKMPVVPSLFLPVDDTDPLALFGDSVNNIEFVVESDDSESEMGSIENPFIIQITESEENNDLVLPSESLSEYLVLTGDQNEVISLDLTSEIDEIKDEIKIEDDAVHIDSDHENSMDTENVEDSGEESQKETTETTRNSRCYVPTCTVDENDIDKVIWFRVPSDTSLRKIWDVCVDRSDKRLGPDDVICDQHFSESDIVYNIDSDNGVVLNATLKEGAVPCIKYHEECCVPICKNKSGNMYCFPVENTANYHLWLYMIKNPALKNMAMKEVLRYRVCALHFESDCFDQSNMLKRTAAPTVKLPEHNLTAISAPVYHQSLKAVPSLGPSHTCAYDDCLNTSVLGKKIFRFPLDPDRCTDWLRICNRLDLISTPVDTVNRMTFSKLGVCADHFEPHCFESVDQLKPDVVPSVSQVSKGKTVPSTSKPQIQPNVSKAPPSQDSSTFTGRCSYKNCSRRVSNNNPFFKFPKDPVRADLWLKACGFTPSSQVIKEQFLKNQQICSRHFENRMFEYKYKLKPDALPIQYRQSLLVNMQPENTEKKKREQENNQPQVSKIIHCAVSSCPNNYGLTHGKGKFPNPEMDFERFSIWLSLVDNDTVKDLPSHEVYEKYMVCLKHFEPHFYMKHGRVTSLSDEAVPTKNLTADIDWFFTSDYYKNRLQKYLSQEEIGSLKNSLQKKSKSKGDGFTMCVLEEDGIRFPKTGHYLHVGRKPESKRKFPYSVYKFFKTGYGLNDDIMVGENVKIHTAIVIDDDDECERQVLQHLLDKRRKQ